MRKNVVFTAILVVALALTLTSVKIPAANNIAEEIPQAERYFTLITPKNLDCSESRGDISDDGKIMVVWGHPSGQNPGLTTRVLAITLDGAGNPISQKELFRNDTIAGPKIDSLKINWSHRKLRVGRSGPKVSGNGQVTVWMVDPDGFLMVSNTDGSNRHLIIPKAKIPGHPAPISWFKTSEYAISDDGKRIVTHGEIYYGAYGVTQRWYPLLALSSSGDGSDARYLFGPEYTRDTRGTRGMYWWMVWDPPYPCDPKLVGISGNGEKVVFSARSSEKTYALYVINWDGSGLKKISPDVKNWIFPYSADMNDAGTGVVFYNPNDEKVYKVNIDGSGLSPILRADGSSPTFSFRTASRRVYLSGDGKKMLARQEVMVDNKKVNAVTLYDIDAGQERIILDFTEPDLPKDIQVAFRDPEIASVITEHGDKVLCGCYPEPNLPGMGSFCLINVKGIARARDFEISAAPSTITILQGEKATFDVRLSSLEDFRSPVSLNISGLPSGATSSFSPVSVTPSGTSKLFITTTSSVSTGTFELTIKGVSGSLVHTSPLKLTIETEEEISIIPTGTVLIAESREVAPGATVQVPIRLERARDIGSIGFELSYEPGVAQVTRVLKDSFMAPATFTYNDRVPGVIRFGFATTQGIGGDGSAAVVEFKAVGAEGSKSPLTLSKGEATDTSGAPLSFRLVNGELTIIEERILGDCNGDKKIRAVDALCALQMYVRLRDIDLIMDVNKDGQVTPEDARQILVMAKSK